eukprot:TRINITY_DN5008_c0_g1_i2.p1 TRINITY_DN5008_c0_g1~~TRINITY_DN5008_c0_g1_i2.p1  ORF type:complete len:127 (-),score=23.37 TRINITY_DN5008_c0_g1_i2:41-421(-)
MKTSKRFMVRVVSALRRENRKTMKSPKSPLRNVQSIFDEENRENELFEMPRESFGTDVDQEDEDSVDDEEEELISGFGNLPHYDEEPQTIQVSMEKTDGFSWKKLKEFLGPGLLVSVACKRERMGR